MLAPRPLPPLLPPPPPLSAPHTWQDSPKRATNVMTIMEPYLRAIQETGGFDKDQLMAALSAHAEAQDDAEYAGAQLAKLLIAYDVENWEGLIIALNKYQLLDKDYTGDKCKICDQDGGTMMQCGSFSCAERIHVACGFFHETDQDPKFACTLCNNLVASGLIGLGKAKSNGPRRTKSDWIEEKDCDVQPTDWQTGATRRADKVLGFSEHTFQVTLQADGVIVGLKGVGVFKDRVDKRQMGEGGVLQLCATGVTKGAPQQGLVSALGTALSPLGLKAKAASLEVKANGEVHFLVIVDGKDAQEAAEKLLQGGGKLNLSLTVNGKTKAEECYVAAVPPDAMYASYMVIRCSPSKASKPVAADLRQVAGRILSGLQRYKETWKLACSHGLTFRWSFNRGPFGVAIACAYSNSRAVPELVRTMLGPRAARGSTPDARCLTGCYPIADEIGLYNEHDKIIQADGCLLVDVFDKRETITRAIVKQAQSQQLNMLNYYGFHKHGQNGRAAMRPVIATWICTVCASLCRTLPVHVVMSWQTNFGRVNQTAIVVNREDWKILLWSQPQVFRTLAFRCSVDITATPGWGTKVPDQNLSQWVAEISNTDPIYNNPIYLPNEECYGGDETMKQRAVPAQVPRQSYASKVRQPKGQAHPQHPPDSLGRKQAGTINMTTDQKELDKLFMGVVMRAFRILVPVGSAASTPRTLQAFVEQQWSALVQRLEQGVATTAVMQGLRSALAELKIAETKAADDAKIMLTKTARQINTGHKKIMARQAGMEEKIDAIALALGLSGSDDEFQMHDWTQAEEDATIALIRIMHDACDIGQLDPVRFAAMRGQLTLYLAFMTISLTSDVKSLVADSSAIYQAVAAGQATRWASLVGALDVGTIYEIAYRSIYKILGLLGWGASTSTIKGAANACTAWLPAGIPAAEIENKLLTAMARGCTRNTAFAGSLGAALDQRASRVDKTLGPTRSMFGPLRQRMLDRLEIFVRLLVSEQATIQIPAIGCMDRVMEVKGSKTFAGRLMVIGVLTIKSQDVGVPAAYPADEIVPTNDQRSVVEAETGPNQDHAPNPMTANAAQSATPGGRGHAEDAKLGDEDGMDIAEGELEDNDKDDVKPPASLPPAPGGSEDNDGDGTEPSATPPLAPPVPLTTTPAPKKIQATNQTPAVKPRPVGSAKKRGNRGNFQTSPRRRHGKSKPRDRGQPGGQPRTKKTVLSGPGARKASEAGQPDSPVPQPQFVLVTPASGQEAEDDPAQEEEKMDAAISDYQSMIGGLEEVLQAAGESKKSDFQ